MSSIVRPRSGPPAATDGPRRRTPVPAAAPAPAGPDRASAISGLPRYGGDRAAHPHHPIADAGFEIARELVAIGGEDGRREARRSSD